MIVHHLPHQLTLPWRQLGEQRLVAALHELAVDHAGLAHDIGRRLLDDVRIVALPPGGEIASRVASLDQGYIVTLI